MDLVAGIKTAAGRLRGVSDVQRAAKRRPRTLGDTDGDSDEEVDRMEIDQTKDDIPSDDQAAEDGGQSTPQPLEKSEATTTDEEDLAPAEAAPSAAKQLQPVQASGRPPSPKEAAPPRRDLPFIRRDSSKTKQRSEPPAEETAGETDDDEL